MSEASFESGTCAATTAPTIATAKRPSSAHQATKGGVEFEEQYKQWLKASGQGCDPCNLTIPNPASGDPPVVNSIRGLLEASGDGMTELTDRRPASSQLSTIANSTRRIDPLNAQSTWGNIGAETGTVALCLSCAWCMKTIVSGFNAACIRLKYVRTVARSLIRSLQTILVGDNQLTSCLDLRMPLRQIATTATAKE